MYVERKFSNATNENNNIKPECYDIYEIKENYYLFGEKVI